MDRMKFLHDSCLVHRDLKPGNIAVGTGKKGKKHLKLIGENHNQLESQIECYKSRCFPDFGSSLHFCPKKDRVNEPKLRGARTYCAITSHYRKTQSPRDDLQSLGYLLAFFLRGNLPWQNVKARSMQQRNDITLAMKLKTKPEVSVKNARIRKIVLIFSFLSSRQGSFQRIPESVRELHEQC